MQHDTTVTGMIDVVPGRYEKRPGCYACNALSRTDCDRVFVGIATISRICNNNTYVLMILYIWVFLCVVCMGVSSVTAYDTTVEVAE